MKWASAILSSCDLRSCRCGGYHGTITTLLLLLDICNNLGQSAIVKQKEEIYLSASDQSDLTFCGTFFRVVCWLHMLRLFHER